MRNNSSIINFETVDPRKNLPAHLARKRGELLYLSAFQRAFVAGRSGNGVGGRQFAVSGYGMADFVWADASGCESKPTLMAFEMKLRDWKKGLSQAYRYSYFADHSVVVLPPEAIGPAKANMNTFKKMQIGLWSFDPKSRTIREIHKPKASRPRNPNAKEKALSLLCRHAKFRKFLEGSNSLV